MSLIIKVSVREGERGREEGGEGGGERIATARIPPFLVFSSMLMSYRNFWFRALLLWIVSRLAIHSLFHSLLSLSLSLSSLLCALSSSLCVGRRPAHFAAVCESPENLKYLISCNINVMEP